MQGWIKLHRKLMESPIFDDPGMLKLWIYCLIKATHKQTQVLLGQQLIDLNPGEFVTGRNSLADDYNRGLKPKDRVSAITLWRWMNTLENMGNLNIKKTNKFSVVSIAKWAYYQGEEEINDHQNEQQMNNKRTSNEHQMNTNKNVKNVKNDKEDILNTSSRKQVYDEDSPYMKMAVYFLGKIKEWKTDYVFRGNMQTWADDFRKLSELDKRSKQQIKDLIDWVTQDSFWQVNILSPKKMREKLDQLEAKMRGGTAVGKDRGYSSSHTGKGAEASPKQVFVENPTGWKRPERKV